MGVLLAMIVLALVVLSIVGAGAGADTLAQQRLAGARAFYAAEGVANMAVREAFVNADEDGNGVVGSIASPSSPLSFGPSGPSGHVASSVSGGTTLHSASSAMLGAARRVDVSISGSGGGGGVGATPRTFTNSSGTDTLRRSVLTAGSWPTPTSVASTKSTPAWVAATPMAGNATLAVALDIDSHLTAAFVPSSGASTVRELTDDAYGSGTRSFDVASDPVSGLGMVVFWDQNNSRLRWRTHNGADFSGTTSFASFGGSSQVEIVRLAARTSGGQKLALMSNTSKELFTAAWNGTSWSSASTLHSPLASASFTCFDVAYEGSSGEALAVYADDAGQIRFRTRSVAGVWSGASSVPGLGVHAHFVELAARPASNEIFLGVLDSGQRVWAARWSGSAWSGVTQVTNSTSYNDRRGFDVMCSPDGTSVMVAYSTGGNTLAFRTWNGSAWSAQQSGPNFSSQIQWVQLQPGPSASAMGSIVTTMAPRLWYAAWSGTAFAVAQSVSTAISDSHQAERASLVMGQNGTTSPAVTGWTQVSP